MSSPSWQFHTPTKLLMAQGLSGRLTEELQALGSTRPLIVTDAGLRQIGLVEQVLEPVITAGLTPVIFDSVEANPSVATVHAGVVAAASAGCDAVVAIGGGSPIDAGKAMAMLCAYVADDVQVSDAGRLVGTNTDLSILDCEYAVGEHIIDRQGLPLITVPTTAGTGSEVTWWSVITDPKRHMKFDVGSPFMAARTALVDGDLMLGLPPAITAATGMDAFTHAIEAFTTAKRGPHTDGLALAAMELIITYLPRAVKDGSDGEARQQMAVAASTAGLAFPNAGLGAVHGLTAPLGGHLGIPHGQANAAVLPAVMRFNAPAVADRYARVARLFGWTGGDDKEGANYAVEAVSRMVRDLGIPTLKELGVPEAMIPQLAADALGPASNCNSNPVPVDAAAGAKILCDAY